jgi:hypothetical protein
MARTALAPTTVALTGTTVTLVAANADGYAIAPQSKAVALLVDNGGGAPIDVTIDVPNTDTATGLSYVEPVITVPAGATRYIKIPFGGAFAHSEDGNKVYVDFSAVTSVTVALLNIA